MQTARFTEYDTLILALIALIALVLERLNGLEGQKFEK